MKKSKNTTALIVIVTLIMVSAILTLGILLYVRGQNLASLDATSNTVSVQSTSSFQVPTPTGNVTVSIAKAGVNKYNLMLDTNGTSVTTVDLKFSISDNKSIVLATKGSITELNDLFDGRTTDNVLEVQAGSLSGFSGNGLLATLSLTDVTNIPTLTLLSSSFINAGKDITINELSPDVINYQYTLQ